jgi:hypothetical protein
MFDVSHIIPRKAVFARIINVMMKIITAYSVSYKTKLAEISKYGHEEKRAIMDKCISSSVYI